MNIPSAVIPLCLLFGGFSIGVVCGAMLSMRFVGEVVGEVLKDCEKRKWISIGKEQK